MPVGTENTPVGSTATKTIPAQVRSSDVAIVFGWMGGQLRHNEKYARHFVERGLVTFIVECEGTGESLSVIIELTSRRVLIGLCRDGSAVVQQQKKHVLPLNAFDGLIDELQKVGVISSKTGESANKAILHISSNGGCMKLRHLLLCLTSKGLVLNTRCVILDSAPGSMQFVNEQVSSLSVDPNIAAFMKEEEGVTDFTNHPVTLGAACAVSERNTEGNVRGPRLFLYSDADELVRAKDVKMHAQRCRDEGIRVFEHMFRGSPHVRHAAVFGDEYWAKVDAFIAKL
ncbi:hypothetical protein CcCBS67573_g09793 [Chytriomyces confervae]|uniref:Uncharacterized protein n=1 Tax=Chytriomyces confervae TaxID=246404 RepID=A0A507DMA9_9FUNG|nr:hypothetical protein CcCBS67573_g09793 [Chytriomyces confervae]